MKRLLCFIMKINILVCLAICFNMSFVFSQHAFKDTSKRYGLHLGLNYGAGIVGGTYGGGALKLGPSVGLHLNERMVLGLELNTGYQIVYSKEPNAIPSTYLSRWFGPFYRFYFFESGHKWNIQSSLNYVYGSYYAYSEPEKIYTTYHTAIVSFGLCYKVKKSRIEMGYRYTFLMNTTPVDAKQVNTLFLGVTRNF